MTIHRNPATSALVSLTGAAVAVALIAVALVAGGGAAVAATAHTHTAPAEIAPTGARIGASGDPTAPTGSHVYFVDSVAGSDSNSGTSATNAWKSLARVTAATFSAGDVIAFKRGRTFTGSATIGEAGTAAKPIVVTAYGSGAQPTLTNPGGLNMLVIDAADVVVTDLAFTAGAEFSGAFTTWNYENSGALLVTSNGTGALVEDSTFSDVGIGVKTYGLHSTVRHNSFRDLRIAYRGMDGDVETSYGAVGVSANNSGIRIAYNDFLNCRSTDSPYGADGGAIEIEGFEHTKDDISIDHNTSQGSQGFLEVTETTSSNVTLSYNVSDDYQQFIAWDTTTTPTGYLAVNNTVVRSHDDSRLFDQYYYREAGPAPASDWITIRNNVFIADAWFSVFDFPKDHNLYGHGLGVGSGPSDFFPMGPGDIVGDPAFEDVLSHDLAPSATSAAVDNGAASTETNDVRGNPTQVGSGTDIGAIERQDAPTGGANAVVDGGFESQTVIGAATSPWFSEGAQAFGVDVNSGTARTGQDNAWLAKAGADWGAVKQTVSVAPNSTYRLVLWVQTSAYVDNAWVGVKSAGGTVLGEIRHGAAAGYTRYVVGFSTGADTSVVLHLGMWGAGPGAFERFDDVSLTKL